jgi:hypothetical protein
MPQGLVCAFFPVLSATNALFNSLEVFSVMILNPKCM